MPEYAIDVVVSPSAPVVDVTAVGVQGPPGVPGPPGPAGEPGPAGPAGSGNVNGPASATDNSIALFDGATGKLLDAGPDGKISGSLSVGTNPAQTGAVRLGNNQAIVARNAANTADLKISNVDPADNVLVGHFNVTPLYLDGSYLVLRSGNAPAAIYLNGPGFYPGDNAVMDLGSPPSTRWRNAYFSGMVNVSETAAPAVPAANCANLWLEDNGAGKSRLMIRFATGAAVQIAIEP